MGGKKNGRKVHIMENVFPLPVVSNSDEVRAGTEWLSHVPYPGTGIQQKGYFLSWWRSQTNSAPAGSMASTWPTSNSRASRVWTMLEYLTPVSCGWFFHLGSFAHVLRGESTPPQSQRSRVLTGAVWPQRVARDWTWTSPLTYCPWNLDKLSRLSVPQFSHSLEENNDSFHFIDLLWGINEIINGKNLVIGI